MFANVEYDETSFQLANKIDPNCQICRVTYSKIWSHILALDHIIFHKSNGCTLDKQLSLIRNLGLKIDTNGDKHYVSLLNIVVPTF